MCLKYISIFCILLLLFLLFSIYQLECKKERQIKENFEELYRVKNPMSDDEPINSKYFRDESKLTTEVFFYVNDEVPNREPSVQRIYITEPPRPPCPVCVECTPNYIYVPDTQITDYPEQYNYPANGIDYSGTARPSITTKPFVPSYLKYYFKFEPGDIVNKTIYNYGSQQYDATINGSLEIDSVDYLLEKGSLKLNNNISGLVQGRETLSTKAQYIKCKNLIVKDFPKGLSISFWMKPNYANQSSGDIIAALCLVDDNGNEISIGHSNKQLYYSMQGNDSTQNSNNPAIPNSKYTHIVWSITSESVHTIYVNGKSIGNVFTDSETSYSENLTDGTTIDNYNVWIGVNALTSEEVTSYYYYSGNIDDLRIYSSTLTQANVNCLYNNGNGRISCNL